MVWRRDLTSISSKIPKEYTYLWNAFFAQDAIKDKPLANLKSKDFLHLFRKWTKNRGITKKRFGNVKSLLNGIYEYAIEQEIAKHNPIREINCSQFTFKPVNNTNDVFTAEERQKLLEHLKSNDTIYALAIQLDFHLVLRIGELLALKWTDIEGDYIHIQSQRLLENTMADNLTFTARTYVNADHIKGNADGGFRYLPLTPEAKHILKRIRQVNPDGEYILVRNGKQLIGDTFNEHLHKYCKDRHQGTLLSQNTLYCGFYPVFKGNALDRFTTALRTYHHCHDTALYKTGHTCRRNHKYHVLRTGPTLHTHTYIFPVTKKRKETPNYQCFLSL